MVVGDLAAKGVPAWTCTDVHAHALSSILQLAAAAMERDVEGAADTQQPGHFSSLSRVCLAPETKRSLNLLTRPAWRSWRRHLPADRGFTTLLAAQTLEAKIMLLGCHSPNIPKYVPYTALGLPKLVQARINYKPDLDGT